MDKLLSASAGKRPGIRFVAAKVARYSGATYGVVAYRIEWLMAHRYADWIRTPTAFVQPPLAYSVWPTLPGMWTPENQKQPLASAAPPSK